MIEEKHKIAALTLALCGKRRSIGGALNGPVWELLHKRGWTRELPNGKTTITSAGLDYLKGLLR